MTQVPFSVSLSRLVMFASESEYMCVCVFVFFSEMMMMMMMIVTGGGSVESVWNGSGWGSEGFRFGVFGGF